MLLFKTDRKELYVYTVRFAGGTRAGQGGRRDGMSSKIAGEQLPRLIKYTDHIVTANHLVEMHRHLVVIHLISHNEVSMLQQKGDAQEH